MSSPDQDIQTKDKTPLGGEADSNSWHFQASHGPLPNPIGHSFPLLTHDSEYRWHLIGTGFYISNDGLFVTARHVIEEVFENGLQVSPLAIFHFSSASGLFGPQEYLIRPIMQCWLGDNADIVLGVAAHATNVVSGEVLTHWKWPLSWCVPPLGAGAATYAFPNHTIVSTEDGQTISFHPDLYEGSLQQFGDFRDLIVMPFPYLQVNFRIHGAASGGPIIGPDGTVIGVNCSEYQPDGPGFGAQIRCLQNAFIEDGVLSGETTPRKVTFAELVVAGAVTVHNFTTSAIPIQSGRVVRFDVPITAHGPCRLGLTMAS